MERTPTTRQAAVLRAATTLFAEKGYASTTTKEIAALAGVAEGTLFKQFATKKDLMLAVTEEVIRNAMLPIFHCGFDEIAAQSFGTFEEFLASFLKSRLRLLEQAIPLVRILLQEVPFQPEVRALFIEQVRSVRLPDIFRPYRARGELADWTDEEILLQVATSVSGYMNTRYILLPELFSQAPGFDPEADMDRFARFVARGLSRPANGWTEEAGNV